MKNSKQDGKLFKNNFKLHTVVLTENQKESAAPKEVQHLQVLTVLLYVLSPRYSHQKLFLIKKGRAYSIYIRQNNFWKHFRPKIFSTNTNNLHGEIQIASF